MSRSTWFVLVLALALAAATLNVLLRSDRSDPGPLLGSGVPGGEVDSSGGLEHAGEDATRDTVGATDADPLLAIHGRCYDTLSRTGVGGVSLALVGHSAWSVTKSRADGTFAFDDVQREGPLRIHPLAPPGWFVAEVSLHVADDQLRGERAIEIAVSAARTDRIRGVLADARTDEPVPALELNLTLPGKRHETLRTDANGYFESVGAYGLGPAKAWVAESPGDSVRWMRSFPAVTDGDVRTDVRLTVPIGPTYRVALDAPGELDPNALWCRLVERSDRGERAWSPVALRAGEPRWARFLRVEHEPDPAWRVRLEVRDREGLWRGSAEVLSTVGVHASTVPIRLVLTGATATGRVTDDGGEPLPRTRVTVLRLDPDPDAAFVPPHEMRTETDGSYDVRALDAGLHRFTYRTGLHAPRALEYELVPGVNALPEVVFPRVGELASIEGVVRVSGDEPPAGHLVLRALDGPPLVEIEPLGLNYDFERDLFPFGFSRLPPGRYELTVRTRVGHEFDPLRQVVTAPSTGVEIGARTDLPGSLLTFEPFDAASGEPVHTFEVTTGRGAHWPLELETVGRGFAWAWRTTEGEPMEWILLADGYRGARGTLADFDANGVARPRLEAGFGTVLFLKEASWLADFAPGERDEPFLVAETPGVADVEVRVGGRTVATSDARGIAFVSLAEAPEWLELRREDYEPLPTRDWNGGRVRATDALLIELAK